MTNLREEIEVIVLELASELLANSSKVGVSVSQEQVEQLPKIASDKLECLFLKTRDTKGITTPEHAKTQKHLTGDINRIKKFAEQSRLKNIMYKKALTQANNFIEMLKREKRTTNKELAKYFKRAKERK